MSEIHGGKAGAWFERMGPSITPPAPPVSVIGWAWAELTTLFVHHLAGIRPGIDRLTIRPRLLDGMPGLSAAASVRGGRVELSVKRSAGGGPRASVNGREVRLEGGELHMRYPAPGSRAKIEFEL
jgi:cellobiose phosphorylase